MTIRSAVTVCIVDEARQGPFVFHDGLEDGCRQAAELGFDAVEIFAPSADALDIEATRALLSSHGLECAAVGTGAGMVKHGLSLTIADESQRAQACNFVRSIIEMGGRLGAPAIIGSMQGRYGGEVSREQAMAFLRSALDELGEYASEFDVPLIYEPLNRYETNLVNTISAGVELLESLTTDHVKLLADIFHMNIEETDIAAALREHAGYIGHIHYVDSNRRAAGLGHLDFAAIAAAMIESEYDGYASAEAFPLPDAHAAALATIDSFRHHFRK
ncbi:MAG: sugar phosphate isomerase/epimerase [Planctomycetales bacterium]|nr:sugar phosphate isomerase/epimerase [Planctomycetales bacterium]